jgi:hypothetical protein
MADIAARERSFVLLCTRARLDAPRAAMLRAAAEGPLDWDRVMSVVRMHGLAPLVARNLKAADAVVPDGVSAVLTRDSVEAAACALTFVSQLSGVQSLLEKHGIRAVAMKGPALAVMAYGSAALRTFMDLDVLVPRHTFRHVRRILAEDGYRTERDRFLDGLYPLAGREDAFLPREAQLARVEVHVAITPWAFDVRLDVAAMIERAQEIEVSGRRIRTLALDDLPLVGAVHGLAHLWTFLKHASEMDALSYQEIDWRVVRERARAARMRRVLHVAQLLARELYETEWSREVIEPAERDGHAVRVAQRLAARMFHARRPRRVDPQKYALVLGCRETLGEKIGYCAKAVFAEWVLKLPWDRLRAAGATQVQ